MTVWVKQSVKNSNAATTMPDILNEATWAFDKDLLLPEEPTVEGRARMRS